MGELGSLGVVFLVAWGRQGGDPGGENSPGPRLHPRLVVTLWGDLGITVGECLGDVQSTDDLVFLDLPTSTPCGGYTPPLGLPSQFPAQFMLVRGAPPRASLRSIRGSASVRTVLNRAQWISKAREGSRPPWVQIPPLPPLTSGNAGKVDCGSPSISRVGLSCSPCGHWAPPGVVLAFLMGTAAGRADHQGMSGSFPQQEPKTGRPLTIRSDRQRRRSCGLRWSCGSRGAVASHWCTRHVRRPSASFLLTDGRALCDSEQVGSEEA